MKKFVLSSLFLLQAFYVFAQQPTGISGKILDAKTQKPLANVVTSIQNSNLTQMTDSEGKFEFVSVDKGNQLLRVRSFGYKDQLLPIEIIEGQMLDLGVLVLEEDQTSSEQQLSLITITENDLGDDNSGSESTSGLLQASRDAFQQSAAFNWGQARFRIRGLDNEYGTILINGISMNKINDGRPQFGNWGGLNDATRNQEFVNGSSPNDYVFGGILGTQQINTRASIYRKGSRVSFSGTNTNYSWRAMGTHASGMDKDGWAFVVSASRRWANEGYFEGTNYGANSFFSSVEKRFNDKHSLNFTSIYAQNSRGRNSPNSDEVTKLAGFKYNSFWGEQNGEQRNSRVRNLSEPIFMLEHFWKLNDKTNINTTLSYQFGEIGNSRLDFQGVTNPDPIYYRNLPSFYTSTYNQDTNVFEGNSAANTLLANGARENFINNRQLDWAKIYRNNNTNAGNSLIVLYEDRIDDKLMAANSVLTSRLADNIIMNAGASVKKLKSHNFQNLLDLLGGDYFNDIDVFGRTTEQGISDLNNPNRKVVVGDTYGYNYNMMANTVDAFSQFKFDYRKFDFYLAQSFSRSEYQREGLYRNGYYPSNSFGKSEKAIFENFGFKGGFTYKISGRQFLSFNGLYQTKAPAMRNVFPNARVNNNATIDIQSEKVASADASWILNMPKLKMRVTGYFSKVKDATRSTFFFADGGGIDDGDPETEDDSAFLAETITGLDRKNIGAEFGAEYQITSTLKATVTGAYGQFTFDSNPNASYTQDAQASATKTNPIVNLGESNLKGYRQAGTPQQAASFGLEYRDPKFWWIGANINYLGDNYVDVAPILRTKNFFIDTSNLQKVSDGIPFPEATEAKAKKILKQERLADFNLLNITGGKSWRIKGTTLGFFASVNNVLDRIYKTGGFEQARNANFRQLNNDLESGTPPFAPRYFYGFGRTYFVNLYLNF